MATISERLREGRTDGTALRWTVTPIHREAADTIDALVEALSGMLANPDKASREAARAALAAVRKGGE
jgi:hypothetical protein